MYTLNNRNIYIFQLIMNIMKSLRLLEILKDYPLFTTNDVSKIVGKNQNYIKTLIYRLRKNNLIYKIEKGKYSVYNDPLVFVSYIYVPSYISLWSAIRYYGLTEQLPKIIFVFVTKSRKSLIFNNTKIEFIKTKHFFGFKKERYNNFDIFIADKEKLVIDCLLSKKVSLDDVIRIIKNVDIKKLILYTLRTKNNSLAKRIGFILDELKIDTKNLIRLVDNNYIKLDYDMQNRGKRNTKWRILDNRT